MIDTKELRRLAQAATKGPWRVDEVGVGFEIAAGDNVVAQAQSIPRDSFQHAARRANAAFIAAANPAAITELLDRIEAAESALSNLGVTPEEAKEGLARHKATLARTKPVDSVPYIAESESSQRISKDSIASSMRSILARRASRSFSATSRRATVRIARGALEESK